MEQQASTVETSKTLTESLRVADLFSLSVSPSTEGGAEPSLRVEDFPDLRKSVPRLVSWTSIRSAVAGSVDTALDIPVIDVFANAWKHYQTLRKDIDESIKSPRSQIVSAVADHEMTSTFHPAIDVLVGSAQVCELVIDVTLTAVVKGLLMTLQNGAVTALEWGSCSGSGAMAIHQITLVEREVFTLKLPGRLPLKKPVFLGPDRAAGK